MNFSKTLRKFWNYVWKSMAGKLKIFLNLWASSKLRCLYDPLAYLERKNLRKGIVPPYHIIT